MQKVPQYDDAYMYYRYSNNIYAIFEAHFMKKSTNNEVELKKKVAYKQSVY